MASDRLIEKKINDELCKIHLKSIQEDITTINDIVTRFLIYSKLFSTALICKKENVDIISWARDMLSPFLSSNISIIFDANGVDTLEVFIDSSLLKHAITNLINNATRFAKTKIQLSIKVDDKMFHIQVEDDGPGLPNEVLDAIFNEYTTVASTNIISNHTGLGLAIVKKVVSLHDGTVRAEQSSLLGGARFIISIPIFGMTQS